MTSNTIKSSIDADLNYMYVAGADKTRNWGWERSQTQVNTDLSSGHLGTFKTLLSYEAA